MTRTIASACGALVVATFAASAQTPPSPTPIAPRPTQSTRTMTEEKTVTVTGCVKPWQGPGDATMRDRMGTPSGTPSTQPDSPTAARPTDPPATRPADPPAAMRAADAGKFTLENVMSVNEEADASVNTLTAESTVNLNAHLNHKVEVTGAVMHESPDPPTATPPSATATRPPVPPGTPPTAAAATTAARSAPTLRVTTLKMVSTTCP